MTTNKKTHFWKNIFAFLQLFHCQILFYSIFTYLSFFIYLLYEKTCCPLNPFKGPVNKCTQDFFKENYEWQTCYCWWSDPLRIIPKLHYWKHHYSYNPPPLFTYTFILLLCYSYITLHIKNFVLCSNKWVL
jgi:hypothetical protein